MESIPTDTFKNLIDQLDDKDVASLQVSTTIINKIIKDYQKENTYYKTRVGRILGFDIPAEIRFEDWEELYCEIENTTHIRDRISTIDDFGLVDLTEYYYEFLKENKRHLDHLSWFLVVAVSNDALDFYIQIVHEADESGSSFSQGETIPFVIFHNAINILKYLLNDNISQKEAFRLIKTAASANADKTFRYLREFIEPSEDNIKIIFKSSIEGDAVNIFLEERRRNSEIWKAYSSEANLTKELKMAIGQVIVSELPDDKFTELVFDATQLLNRNLCTVLVKDERMTARLLNGMIYPVLHRSIKQGDLKNNYLASLVYNHPLLDLNIISQQDLVHLDANIVSLLIDKIPSLFTYNTYRFLYTHFYEVIEPNNSRYSFLVFKRTLNSFIDRSPELADDEALYYELLSERLYPLAILITRSENKNILEGLLEFVLVKFKDIEEVEFKTDADASISNIIWLLKNKLGL